MQRSRSFRTPLPAAGAAAALALGLLGAERASAINYVPGANGTTWGVHDGAAPALDTGSIRDVTGSDALIGFGGIRVRVAQNPQPRFNGELMRGFGLRFDGYEDFRTTSAVDLGGIEITRGIHVERSDQWARWVDTFANTTKSTQTLEVVFGGQTGYGAVPGRAATFQSGIAETSSGDAQLTSADRWAVVTTRAGDLDELGRVAGPSGVALRFDRAQPNFFTGAFDNVIAASGHEANYQGYATTLTLRPGETRSLVNFVAIGARSDALATAGHDGQSESRGARRRSGARRPVRRRSSARSRTGTSPR